MTAQLQYSRRILPGSKESSCQAPRSSIMPGKNAGETVNSRVYEPWYKVAGAGFPRMVSRANFRYYVATTIKMLVPAWKVRSGHTSRYAQTALASSPDSRNDLRKVCEGGLFLADVQIVGNLNPAAREGAFWGRRAANARGCSR